MLVCFMGESKMKIGELPSLALMVVIIAISAAVGVYVLATIKTSLGSGEEKVNATIEDGISGIGDITSWLAIIVIVVMGAIIIRLLFDSFGGATRGA